MTIPDHFAAARKRVANQIELDTARAKSDTRSEFKRLAEWINRSFGQRASGRNDRADCPTSGNGS